MYVFDTRYWIILLFFVTAANAKLHIKSSPCRPNTEKIIGGHEVDITSYPFQVAILLGNDFNCGGSIITPRHILSAAHCFVQYSQPEQWLVRSGSSFRNKGGVLSNVSQIIIHEYFRYDFGYPGWIAYDVAILVLQEPLKYNEKTKAIPLITRDIQDGEDVYVSGWGFTRLYSDPSEKLKALRLRTDDEVWCRYWDPLEKKICARTGGFTSTCYGDSGGPLTTQGQLVGILSGSPSGDCANPRTPSIFTSVLYHKAWIEKNIRI